LGSVSLSILAIRFLPSASGRKLALKRLQLGLGVLSVAMVGG